MIFADQQAAVLSAKERAPQWDVFQSKVKLVPLYLVWGLSLLHSWTSSSLRRQSHMFSLNCKCSNTVELASFSTYSLLKNVFPSF